MTSVRIYRSSGGSVLSAKIVIDFGPRFALHSRRERFLREIEISSTCLDQPGGRAAGAGRALAEFLFIAVQEPNEPVGHIVRDVVRRWRIRVPVLFANESLNGVGQAFDRGSRDMTPPQDTPQRWRRGRPVRCRFFGSYPIRADGQLTCWSCSLQRFFWLPVCSVWRTVGHHRPITSHRTSATTLSAAGAGSDNSPARVMSSMECSVMYLE